jgi:hypothetical protein
MQDVHVKIKSWMAMAQAAFNKKAHFTSKLELNLKKKPVWSYIRSTGLYGAETLTLGKKT